MRSMCVLVQSKDTSLRGGEYWLHYNGDFSGDVVVDFPEDSGLGQVQIPYQLFRALAAEQIRSQRIGALEQMTTEELLDIPATLW